MIEFQANKEITLEKPTRIEDLVGLFKTSSAVPTHIPKKFSEQIAVYVSGGTKRLYVWDTANSAWLYSTLT